MRSLATARMRALHGRIGGPTKHRYSKLGWSSCFYVSSTVTCSGQLESCGRSRVSWGKEGSPLQAACLPHSESHCPHAKALCNPQDPSGAPRLHLAVANHSHDPHIHTFARVSMEAARHVVFALVTAAFCCCCCHCCCDCGCCCCCCVLMTPAVTCEVLYALPGHKGSVNEVVFHPKEPIVGSCSNDRTIFLGELADS